MAIHGHYIHKRRVPLLPDTNSTELYSSKGYTTM